MPTLPAKYKDPAYHALLAKIRREMAKGIKKIERLIERQKVVFCWNTGRVIHRYIYRDQQIRGSITAFYNDLSDDLEINFRTLQQYEQFYRSFPKLNLKENLSWSHYRHLMSVPDEKERLRWMARIQRDNINSRDFQLLLIEAHRPKTINVKLKDPGRGKLYTYKILHAPSSADGFEGFDSPWFVDCGFANRIEAPETQAILDNKRLYTSVKTENGYRLKVTNAVVDELYTFKAKVLRVIDGDTVLTAIDQGFGIWTEQRLRLKGIDAPELDTLAGKKAKKWVENELSGLSFIIVKTHKSDKYDRYLVDVFYAKGESDPQRVASEGAWLNGRLVELGLAVVWEP